MKKIVRRLLVVGMVIVAALAEAAIGLAAPFAYIPNSGSNSVLVIDQQTNKIVTTIPVGTYPVGVAVNAAGSRAYITNYISNTVMVIDGTTQTVIGSPISVGTDPVGVIVSPDNTTVYVANEVSETISIINALNNTVIDTITGVPCTSLVIDPSGSRLYAASYLTNQLWVIDTATRTVVGTPLAFTNTLYELALNPTGTHLYIGNNSNSILVVRTADLAVTPILVGEDTGGISVHPSGSFIYAAGQTSIHVIDTATNAVIKSMAHGGTYSRVSFNSDGTRAYVPLRNTADVKIIDTVTHTVIDTIVAGSTFGIGNIYGSFVAPHRHVWSGTTSFPIKLNGLGADGKFVKGAGELTGRVIEMRTLGSKYSLLFLSDDQIGRAHV